MRAKNAVRSWLGRLVIGGVTVGVVALCITLLSAISVAAGGLNPNDLLPPNGSPVLVTVMYPKSGQSLETGKSVSVLVDAAGAYPLSKIKVTLSGPESISTEEIITGSTTSVRLSIPLGNLPLIDGTYKIYATAHDNRGYSAVSNVVEVDVTPKSTHLYDQVEVSSWEDVEEIADKNNLHAEVIVALNPQTLPGDGSDFEPVVINVPSSAPGPDVAGIINAPAYFPAPGETSSGDATTDFFTGVQTALSSMLGPDDALPAPSVIISAEANACQAKLVFSQNPDTSFPSSIGYFIYRQVLGSPSFERVSTLKAQPGEITFYEAKLPPGNYLYYVAAFTGAGESMSDIVSIDVTEENCGQYALDLGIWEKAEFTIPDNITDFYCYISMLGSPWARVPQNPGEFITPDEEGVIEIPKEMPIPVFYEQNSYHFAANCWGWSGDALMDLGTAEGTLTETSYATWGTEVSNGNFSFNGIFRSHIAGGEDAAPPERWFVPAPIEVKVVGTVFECGVELFQKAGIQGSREICQPALESSNILLSWDWSKNISLWPAVGETPIPTINAPDKYQIYRVEPRFLADPIVETIQYNNRFTFIPRGSIEECYYVKALYYDTGGYAHFSDKSATVCVPPLEATNTKNIVLTPERVFSMRIDRYDLTGIKKDPSLGVINCEWGDTAYAVAAPQNTNTVFIYQQPCGGKRYQMFATFDLSPIRYKQVERATISFDKVPTDKDNSSVYNSSCLSSVTLHQNPIVWSTGWDSTALWSHTIRDHEQTHFEFDITLDIRIMAEVGKGTGDYPLLIGLVPDNFKSRDERGIGYFACTSFFENIKIDITHFEY